jgi:Tripartite tricarboxylate transporter TctB family
MNSKIVSGLLLALCAIGIWQTTIIPESTMYSEVGPILAPSVVIAALTILGIIYLAISIKNKNPDCIEEEDGTPLQGGNLRIFYFLLGGLVFILLIKPLGFVIPATICGAGIAKSFDAPFNLKTFAICFAISMAFWGLFSALLGVDLGPIVRLPF